MYNAQFLLYSHQKTQYTAVMVSILNHYYYTGPSNDIIAKDDSINTSRTAKQIRWFCSGEVRFQTNLTNKQLLKASVIHYIHKLSQGKQIYWTHGQCLLQWEAGNVSDKHSLSLSLTDKLKALSPCGVPASPTQKSLNMSSDLKHVPLFK